MFLDSDFPMPFAKKPLTRCENAQSCFYRLKIPVIKDLSKLKKKTYNWTDKKDEDQLLAFEQCNS